MNFTDVKSSNIEAVAFEDGVMAVRFKGSGKVYHYTGVTEKEYDDLRIAKSIGRHFAQNILTKHKGVLQQKEEPK